jgi:hypothetical protein
LEEIGNGAHQVYTQEIMAKPVKLTFRSLSLDETAKLLGVPPARAREIESLVENGLNGARRQAKHGLSVKRVAKKTTKRAGAKKAR